MVQPDLEDSTILKVAEALQDEVGYGRGRLDTVTRNELGLSIGDIVEIHGRRRDPTVAIVWRARTEDEGKGIIRVDGLIRENAKVNLGDKVEVKKTQVKPAQKVVLAPMMDQSGRVQFDPGIEEVILRGLNRRPLTKGDVVIVPGLTLMGGRLPFTVTVVQPKGIIQIQADTVIQVHEDPKYWVKEEELTGQTSPTKRDVNYNPLEWLSIETEGETEEIPDEGSEEVDYESMTVPLLKEALKEQGLPVSGKKAELIERLKGEAEEIPDEGSEVEAESLMEKLEKLIERRNNGEITSEEFEEMKKEILGK